MTELGFKCMHCGVVTRFDAEEERFPIEDFHYGMYVKAFKATCPKCGKRDEYPTTENKYIILGGPDAKVQTPKAIIEEVIDDLNKCFDDKMMGWNNLEEVIAKLEKARDKL
jgi:hypothetical protein